MRKSKNWLALLVAFAMLLGLVAMLPVSADGDTDAEKHISMAKTEFYEDEVIEIVATGDSSKKDWIGYNTDGNTGSSVSWWYITEENAGKSVNLLTGKPAEAGDTGLPAGKYWAYYVPNNGYAYSMTETISFEVLRRPAEPTDPIDAVRPEGDGSYLYPYLIGSAENLSWMAKQIGSGIDPTGAVNPFAGKYFRQTCDIDLGGRALHPIGYAYLDEDTYAVFGGDYDGQGYKIFNGAICDAEVYDADLKHGTGLFGIICDAAIRNAYLNTEQLKWLDETLAKDRDVSKPTFLFLHQSLYNTVAGSFEGQGWNGATPEKALRDLLKKYPEVVMFNGHSHWTLDSDGCMHERDGELPTIFNTASTAYLWTSYNKTAGETLEGSQGYYVRIYKDSVSVFGRDFSTGEWIPSALFVVDYSDMSEYEPQPPEQETGTDTGDLNGSESGPIPDATESGTDSPDAVQSVGCQSTVGLGTVVLICGAAGVALMARKKKKDD